MRPHTFKQEALERSKNGMGNTLHKIDKVVFALPSPFIGGFSKWNILEDEELEKFPPFFAKQPEVIGSVLESEAKAVFDKTPLWMFGSNARNSESFK